MAASLSKVRSLKSLNGLSRNSKINNLNVLTVTRGITETQDTKVEYLEVGDKAIAFRRVIAKNDNLPGVIYCPSFQSNMEGVKATAIERYCQANGTSFVRFDYQGVGDSSGDVRECTISDWRKDVVHVLDQLTAGPQVLVGNGLGALIALHTAIQRPQRIKSILGINTAADLPERLFANYPGDIMKKVKEDGEAIYDSEYNSYIITKKLIDDAKKHTLLTKPVIPISCVVRLLHGMRDTKVNYNVSIELAKKLSTVNIHVFLRKNADHRFSQPEDITLMFEMLNCMVHGVTSVKDLAVASWEAFSVASRPRERGVSTVPK